MKKTVRVSLFVLVGVIFIGTIVFLADKSKKKPIVYSLEKAELRTIIKKTIATGSVVPRKEVMIKPHISGIVQELYFEPGQMIKVGDVIAKIKVIPDMLNLNAAESRLTQATLNFNNEKLRFNRQKQLFEKSVISEADFQVAELSYKGAMEEMDASKNNLEIIKDGINKKSAVASNTLIRSTITGMILDIPVKEGNSVIQSNSFNDGTTIAIIADLNDMIFEGKVDETEVGKIREGMKLTLTIGAIDNTEFDAILEYISPKGVEENGAIQFKIKAKVTLKEGQFIRSGYSANADIELERRDNVIAISEGCISFTNDSSFVEILQGDTANIPQKFVKKHIVTGLSDGLFVEVKQGVSKADYIKGNQK